MPIDEILAQVRDGVCVELFASGTAAIVSPISLLADGDGTQYVPSQVDRVAAAFRESLLSIQERRAPDPYGWTRDIQIAGEV
jgi:branched-chain amino acid aminotransferase